MEQTPVALTNEVVEELMEDRPPVVEEEPPAKEPEAPELAVEDPRRRCRRSPLPRRS